MKLKIYNYTLGYSIDTSISACNEINIKPLKGIL